MKCACDECGRAGGYALYCLRCAEMFIKQSEQEPVGKFAKFTDGIWREVTDGSAGVPLYAAPQQTEQSKLERNYMDLIMSVEKAYPNETRHQTALRYIRERENMPRHGVSDAVNDLRKMQAKKEEDDDGRC